MFISYRIWNHMNSLYHPSLQSKWVRYGWTQLLTTLKSWTAVFSPHKPRNPRGTSSVAARHERTLLQALGIALHGLFPATLSFLDLERAVPCFVLQKQIATGLILLAHVWGYNDTFPMFTWDSKLAELIHMWDGWECYTLLLPIHLANVRIHVPSNTRCSWAKKEGRAMMAGSTSPPEHHPIVYVRRWRPAKWPQRLKELQHN